MNTINNNIPFVPENTVDPAAGLNLSLKQIDALMQVRVHSVGANTPPVGVEGERHIVGTAPTGAWLGQANKLARFRDGVWQFYDARMVMDLNGLIHVKPGATWSALSAEWTAELIGQAEAEAGTGTTARKWNAQRVWQAIYAVFNSVTSAFGRSFVMSADAAAGRTALQLGTAAVRDEQTSATDATAGRLMRVGAFGLGAQPVNIADMNELTWAGFGRVVNINTPNAPTAGVGAGMGAPYSTGMTSLGAQSFLTYSTPGGTYLSFPTFYARSKDSATTFGPWVKHFHDRNILGTVSQSAGVPTGAVIERGSNANGEYIKFADGTMLCWINQAPGSQATSTAMAGGFRSAGITWAYPAAFVDTNVVATGTPSDLLSNSVVVYSTGSASCAFVFSTVTSQAAANRGARLHAIGRWY